VNLTSRECRISFRPWTCSASKLPLPPPPPPSHSLLQTSNGYTDHRVATIRTWRMPNIHCFVTFGATDVTATINMMLDHFCTTIRTPAQTKVTNRYAGCLKNRRVRILLMNRERRCEELRHFVLTPMIINNCYILSAAPCLCVLRGRWMEYSLSGHGLTLQVSTQSPSTVYV
jgi:hypothetical protein